MPSGLRTDRIRLNPRGAVSGAVEWLPRPSGAAFAVPAKMVAAMATTAIELITNLRGITLIQFSRRLARPDAAYIAAGPDCGSCRARGFAGSMGGARCLFVAPASHGAEPCRGDTPSGGMMRFGILGPALVRGLASQPARASH